MRVLVTTIPACGHFFPMVALSWALRCAGHQVLVAGPRSIAKEARFAGLPSAVVGSASPQEMWANSRNPTGQDNWAVAEFGIAIAEQTVDDLLALAEAWRPDVVISEPMELTGPIAAARNSIPLVSHRWGLQFPEHLRTVVAATIMPRLAALHERFGLDHTDRPADMVIENCPPSLRQVETEGATSMRYVPYCGAGIMPAWLFEPRHRPRICVSMGSLPLRTGIDGLRLTVDALAEEPVEVVVAGAGSRDSGLGTLPPNARAAGWLPHDQLLPSCDAVVHHAGAGSSMVSLIHGLPQLVLPQLGDQFHNADQLVRRGVAEKVELAKRSVDAIGPAVACLLTRPAYRRNAQEVQAEIAAMRPPSDVVGDIEKVGDVQKVTRKLAGERR